jgi:hypothetical protein
MQKEPVEVTLHPMILYKRGGLHETATRLFEIKVSLS